jgi:hypothetical protein
MIGISGTIELHQGKPEIEVTSTAQIKGVDSQPVASQYFAKWTVTHTLFFATEYRSLLCQI